MATSWIGADSIAASNAVEARCLRPGRSVSLESSRCTNLATRAGYRPRLLPGPLGAPGLLKGANSLQFSGGQVGVGGGDVRL